MVILLVAACKNTDTRVHAVAAEQADTIRNSASQIELPEVPSSLTEPADRACWLAVHYWDRLDFADTSLSLDTAFMEQSFANFTTVMAMTGDSVRFAAVTALMDRAAAVPAARDFLADIAGRYLYDPGSPVYNEDLYLPFVDYEIGRGDSSPAMLQIREDILKNRPGSPAPDFVLTYRDGSNGHLLRNDGADILLLFYEPDCDVCHSLMERLAADAAIADGVGDGTLRVVAVYQGENTELWREHAATLPLSWEVARDAEGAVDSRELYIIRATPTIYLISDGIIQAKDLRL